MFHPLLAEAVPKLQFLEQQPCMEKWAFDRFSERLFQNQPGFGTTSATSCICQKGLFL
jgi:hypothetical protein